MFHKFRALQILIYFELYYRYLYTIYNWDKITDSLQNYKNNNGHNWNNRNTSSNVYSDTSVNLLLQPRYCAHQYHTLPPT